MKNRIKNKRGFTLIECVIAIAVIMIVSLAALAITQQSSKADPDITSFYKAKSLSDGMLSSFQYTHDYAAYQNAIKDRTGSSGGSGGNASTEGEADETPTDPKLNAFIGNYNLTNIKREGTELVFTIGDESEGNSFRYNYGDETTAKAKLTELTTGGKKTGKDEYVYTCDANADGFAINFFMKLTRTVTVNYTTLQIVCEDVLQSFGKTGVIDVRPDYSDLVATDSQKRYYNGAEWIEEEHTFRSYEDMLTAAAKIAGNTANHPTGVALTGRNPAKDSLIFGVTFRYSNASENLHYGLADTSATRVETKYTNCALKSSVLTEKYLTTLEFNQMYLEGNNLHLKLYTKDGDSDSVADKLSFGFANQADLLYYFSTNFMNYAVGNEELSTAQTLSDARRTVDSILKRGEILKFKLNGSWIESGSIASLIEGKSANRWYWGDALDLIDFSAVDNGYKFKSLTDGKTYYLKPGASGYLMDYTNTEMATAELSELTGLKKSGKCAADEFLWNKGSLITVIDPYWTAVGKVNIPGYPNSSYWFTWNGSKPQINATEQKISEADKNSISSFYGSSNEVAVSVKSESTTYNVDDSTYKIYYVTENTKTQYRYLKNSSGDWTDWNDDRDTARNGGASFNRTNAGNYASTYNGTRELYWTTYYVYQTQEVVTGYTYHYLSKRGALGYSWDSTSTNKTEAQNGGLSISTDDFNSVYENAKRSHSNAQYDKFEKTKPETSTKWFAEFTSNITGSTYYFKSTSDGFVSGSENKGYYDSKDYVTTALNTYYGSNSTILSRSGNKTSNYSFKFKQLNIASSGYVYNPYEISTLVNGVKKWWSEGGLGFTRTSKVTANEVNDNVKGMKTNAAYLQSLKDHTDCYAADDGKLYWNPTIVKLENFTMRAIKAGGKYWNGSDFVSGKNYYENSVADSQISAIKSNSKTSAEYTGLNLAYSEKAIYYFNDIDPANAYRKRATAILGGVTLSNVVDEKIYNFD